MSTKSKYGEICSVCGEEMWPMNNEHTMMQGDPMCACTKNMVNLDAYYHGDREKLISKLKILVDANNAKQRRYQKENDLGSDVGCITREACEIAALVPQMQALGITFDDLR